MPKHIKYKRVFQAVMVIVGGILAAYGLETVLIPNNVSDGGVTGLSIVGSELLGVPLGLLLVILNIPFILIGYKRIGKTFTMLSILGIASLAASTTFMHQVPAIVEGDTLLITVVGGIILGLGMGIALRNGGALDGVDMLAVILSKKLPFSTSDLILFLNVFVFIFVSFVFGLQGAILSAIAYFIASKVIHIVEVGLSGSRTVQIITDQPKTMMENICENINGNAMYRETYSGVSNEKFKEIVCVINRLEETKLKDLINEIDKNAFITVYDVAEVKGVSFR